MADAQKLTLLACQIDIPLAATIAAREAHLASSAAKVRRELARQTADLVVLPELSSISYDRHTFGNLAEIGEPLDGASFRTWSAVAQEFGVHVSYGFARKAADGYRISIGVAGPDGRLVGHYDKLHMCQYGASMEKEYFGAGSHLFTFSINGITIAPIICYDIRIPELSRALTLTHGVDLILHCGAYFRDESFATWHSFITTRAMENQIFILSLNRAGSNWGNSIFCLPWMDETTPAVTFAETCEEFRIVTLDRADLLRAREEYTFLKDRLPDYNALETG